METCSRRAKARRTAEKGWFRIMLLTLFLVVDWSSSGVAGSHINTHTHMHTHTHTRIHTPINAHVSTHTHTYTHIHTHPLTHKHTHTQTHTHTHARPAYGWFSRGVSHGRLVYTRVCMRVCVCACVCIHVCFCMLVQWTTGRARRPPLSVPKFSKVSFVVIVHPKMSTTLDFENFSWLTGHARCPLLPIEIVNMQ